MGYFKNVIVKNARIWDGDKYINGALSISAGKIVAIGEMQELENAEIIDAGGKLLTPGLIDIHTHLKNISNNTFGTDTSLCTIPFGVTAAVDGGACKGDKAYLDTLPVKTAVFVAIKVEDDVPSFENIDELCERYGDAFLGLKVYFDTSSKNVKSIGLLQKVCEYAKSRGFKVMVHTTGSPVPMMDVVNTLNKGDVWTHVYHGGVNTSADDGFKSVFAAKEKGIVVDAGMAGHVHTDFAVLKKAIDAGALPDTISTDITRLSAFVRGGRYGLTTCMGICKHLGMKEEDILRCVTTNAAKAVDREDWGKLTVGGEATFAILDTECEGKTFSFTDGAGNTVSGNVGFNCVLTAIKGEIVYVN